MNYEQKYKEALERAKQFSENPLLEDSGNVVEYIFPELKNEDERIRKEIIKTVELYGPKTRDPKVYNDMLVWLEKQGEKKSIWHNEDEGPKRGSLILLIMQSGTPIVAKIIEPNHTFNHGERWAYIDDLLENQGEQKPADKIEPKFKVGYWIVNNNSKDVFLIKSINNGYCTLEDIKGNIISPCLPPCESESHLWTIQDAKDGDVLVDKYGNIGIYQGDKNVVTWHSYCYCGTNKGFYDEGSHEFPCCLATKEQREQLYKAMHEAGYEWNAEKKELKLLITNGGDL